MLVDVEEARQLGRPHELAVVVARLASDASSIGNGAALAVARGIRGALRTVQPR